MPIFSPLNPPMTDWSGKTVWMIGASTGIGRATASALHARGARVVVSARKLQALEDFVAQHPGSVALALDATDGDAIAAATHRVLRPGGAFLVYQFSAKARDFMAKHFGRIDEGYEPLNVLPCKLFWGWKD